MEKVVIITGATSGIGQNAAIKFATNGWKVIATGRRNDRLIELKSYIKEKFNSDIDIFNFDVRDKSQVEENCNEILSKFKKIDLLINNAGLSLGLDNFEDADIDDWENMIDTNLKGLLYISKIISNNMKSHSNGHIINIGSIAGYNVYPRGHVYCASKFAVRAISEGMREDLAQYNIKVSSLNPGMVETEFSIVRFKGNEEKAKQVYNGFKPLSSDDIANTLLYMAEAPEHVNLSEVIILPKAQANAYFTHKVF